MYAIGSVAEPFTAPAVMALVEEGRVDVGRPAAAYLPDLPEALRSIRVDHLLSHTSGVQNFTNQMAFHEHVRDDRGPREVLALVRDPPLNFTPGERWKYSNTNSLILGLLFERVSGEPYGRFLRRRFPDPLGMADTRMNHWLDVVPGRVSGYGRTDGGGLRNATSYSTAHPCAAGGLLSSAHDLALWLAALNDRRALTADSVSAMWTPQGLNDGSACEYGYGWVTVRRNGRSFVAHSGDINGFWAGVICYSDTGLSAVALCNLEGVAVNEIARAAIGLYETARRCGGKDGLRGRFQ